VSQLNVSCAHLFSDLEDLIVRRKGGGGASSCIMLVGGLMKIFQFVPVRKSCHEPTSVRSDLG